MTLNIRSPWSAITSTFYNYHFMGKNGDIMNLNGVTGDAINILLTQRAMSPVPSLTANASSILALAMFRTACIARFLIALGSSPIVVAPKNHIPFRYSNSKPLFFLQSIVTSIYVTLITFANLILTSIFRCHHIQLFIKFVIFFLRDKRKSAFEGSTYTIQDQCSEGVLHNFWRKMRSALSSKCKIDFLSAEPFRKAGKRHGFRQVPNSSCRGGNFLRLRTLFHGTRGERETRKASTLEYEKGDLLSCPWFWQRNVGKVGRSFE